MELERRALGKSGLTSSLVGLGCGGNSRLGLSNGLSEEHAADVVRAALDLGITLIDTARVYQTEKAVGLALRGRRREQLVLSSKSPYLDENGQLLSPQAFEANLEASLSALGVETIDLYFIHGLRLEYYRESVERFVPVLEKARQAGKIRLVGVTEAFERDTRHEMLQAALNDGCWDAMMVGYNLLNPSARERVLAATRQKGIATLGMFAVRRALIDEERLRVLLGRLAQQGLVEQGLAASPDLLDALALRGVSASLSEAAYRFCAYEPALDCVLSGTGSAQHLQANLQSVRRGPLPAPTLARLASLFGHIDSISAQLR